MWRGSLDLGAVAPLPRFTPNGPCGPTACALDLGRETELTRSEILLSATTVRGLTCLDRVAVVVRHFPENLPETPMEHPRDTSGGQGELRSNGVPAGKADRSPDAIGLLRSTRLCPVLGSQRCGGASGRPAYVLRRTGHCWRPVVHTTR